MSRNSTSLVRLSKRISQILRHDPASAGVVLGAAGSVALGELVDALRREVEFAGTTAELITLAAAAGEKPRFDLTHGLIRARWGHSIDESIVHPVVPPPERLFHGTSHAAWSTILVEGLRPMTRQYVHLSPDRETARIVGARHDRTPLLLGVQAAAAADAGVVFHRPDPGLWLCLTVPPRFLEVL